MVLSFLERAKRLGHSVELLEQGIPVSSTITVETVEQLKAAVLQGNQFAGPDLAQQLFGAIPLTNENDDRTAAGTIRRVQQYLYTDAELGAGDRERIKSAFPMKLDAISIPKWTPTGPVKINNPAQKQTYNVGTLTLNQGIYISVYSTSFVLCVDDVIRNGNNGNPTAYGDINIYGMTGATGKNGDPGNTGATGSHGTGSSCTVSGSEPGANGGPGGTGGTGNTGTNGTDGSDGQPSYDATINITGSVTGNLYIFSKSGTGGQGGQGGQGGRGGQGGDGADGANCECTGTNGGNAGNGGNGGMGGTAGNGGNGKTRQADIVVNVINTGIKNVSGSTMAAPVGGAGLPGVGGNPGPAGSKGSKGKHSDDGRSGSSGVTGSTGPSGKPGTTTGLSATITINPI